MKEIFENRSTFLEKVMINGQVHCVLFLIDKVCFIKCALYMANALLLVDFRYTCECVDLFSA